MVEPWRAEFWFICRGHLLTSFQERPMPGHTQLKGLLQDGEGMAKAIRRKGNSEMSAEKIKENLKGLFSSCAVLPLPALPGTDGCGSRTSPLPWGPQDWGPDEQRWRRGTVSGNPKRARVQLLRRQRPRGESPQLNAPTSVRGQISNRLISCAAVRKNRKDKWITFTPNLPKRIRVNADKDLSSELGGRKCFAGPTNLWVFQYNTC